MLERHANWPVVVDDDDGDDGDDDDDDDETIVLCDELLLHLEQMIGFLLEVDKGLQHI